MSPTSTSNKMITDTLKKWNAKMNDTDDPVIAKLISEAIFDITICVIAQINDNTSKDLADMKRLINGKS